MGNRDGVDCGDGGDYGNRRDVVGGAGMDIVYITPEDVTVFDTRRKWPDQIEYVLYSEAQARIDALEWLVEVQALKVHRVIHAGEWAQKNAGPSVREAWRRRENSNHELRDTLKAARDAVVL